MLDSISSSGSFQIVRTTSVSEGNLEVQEKSEALKPQPVEEKNLNFSEKEKVEKVVESLNNILTPTQTSLKFEFHDKLNEYYVTLVDEKTKEVVKEIPSKKMLDFYAAMTEFIGVMMDKKI